MTHVEAIPFVPEQWMDDALCAQTDPEAFFPEKGASTRPAKSICGACEVREQCLEFALRTGAEAGVWGGLSHSELTRLRASVPKVKPTSPIDYDRIAQLVAAGLNDDEVSETVGCSNATVLRWRRRNGIGPNPRRAHKPEVYR